MSLVLQSSDPVLIARELHRRVEQAPSFLQNTPVVVDFSFVEIPANYNFNLLFKVVRQRHLLPVAVCGLPQNLQARWQCAGVPAVEANSRRGRSQQVENPPFDTAVTTGPTGETLVIPRSLAKGERCYARDADLIVIGDCQSDNEIIADGHVHVYGALRGRVVAGFQGNRSCRIFCSAMLAEMISIAGVAKTDLPDIEPDGPTIAIHLDQGKLVIQT